MKEDHAALLEVMEQQEVSVAKAGLVASLPARATVLAAANPAKGHYDRSKDVARNLNMSPAMLSRFDLIFVMEDQSDNHLDSKLSEHVLAVRSGDASRILAAQTSLTAPMLLDGPEGAGTASRRPLEESLRLSPAEAELNPLPAALLRRLIAYARAYVRPVLSDDACREIQAFWLHLRSSRTAPEGVPVTMRQLDGLVRLAEARARVDLAELVTRDHALDAIDVVRATVLGAGEDAGTARASKRRRGSKVAEMERLLDGLAALCARGGRDVVQLSEIYDCADRMSIQGDLGSMVSALNDAGELLKRGPGCFVVPAAKKRMRG